MSGAQLKFLVVLALVRRTFERSVSRPNLVLVFYNISSSTMSHYGCLYFDFDKSVCVIPKSRCILRGPYEPGKEADVNWTNETGEKQRFVGIILKTAPKGEYIFHLRLF